MGGGPSFGFRDSMGVRQAGGQEPCAWVRRGAGAGAWGPEGPRALLCLCRALTPGSTEHVAEMQVDSKWWGKEKGAAGWRPWPCLQPLEGGVISPPFVGVALLVAVAAGVPHVVQRHHHLVWVRVFVQFHHARHHGGPAVWSEQRK